MNYLILINKSNLIEDNYFNDLKLVNCKDVLGDDIKVEELTFNAYLELKNFLETKNIFVGLDSAYRSIDDQQEIIDDYTIKYGADYVKKYVAPIRTSEHHTGLAVDLALIVNGKKCIDPEDLFDNEDVFLEIHKYLSQFGFILRYPKEKEEITGYNYEPWHIRYVGKEVAEVICKNNLTLEEYVEYYYNKRMMSEGRDIDGK